MLDMCINKIGYCTIAVCLFCQADKKDKAAARITTINSVLASLCFIGPCSTRGYKNCCPTYRMQPRGLAQARLLFIRLPNVQELGWSIYHSYVRKTRDGLTKLAS